MSRSKLPNVGKVRIRLGSRKAAWLLRFPNLPNLPNVALRVACAYRHGRVCAHTRACTIKNMSGRLGRLGKARHGAGFELPNLFRTMDEVGRVPILRIKKEGGK